MNWPIERKLKKLGERSNPDRAFVLSLEKRLRAEAGHPTWWMQGWKWAVSGATIITLVGSGTGVYAYTSDDVLPDHPLYGLRKQIEHVEEATAFTTEQKAKVHIKQLNRRLHENEILTEHKKPLSKEASLQFGNAVEELIDETSKLSDDKQEQVDKDVETIEVNHETTLMKQRDDAATPEEKTKAEEVLKKTRDRIKNTIDSMQESRKLHFKRIREQHIERLQQRLEELNKRPLAAEEQKDATESK